ncbi:MAG: NAD(P)H-hydrate dehydratase [Planctomycetota bacterium]|nr:NAD(P)H-hydrate dehydratase [Planctomycetota bacterium]MDA1138783.1 NAD(P)H-hydrate dehydratase [Planctomycetota bacterium]
MPAANNEAPLPLLPGREISAHKGDFGRVLVVAGSRNMPGAAYLTADAVLLSGAGLCMLATPESALPAVSAKLTCNTFLPLAENSHGGLSPGAVPALLKAAVERDVVAIGPGLGQLPDTSLAIRKFVTAINKPIVLDADGLNAFAIRPETLLHREAPLIITPHPGEMARLTGSTTRDVQSSRQEIAADFALKHKCIVLLKGSGTVITDGNEIHINRTGNPGMATGGSGDVLTGIIAALLAQGLRPLDAARLGAHVHGLAGDLAAQAVGQISLIATDLLCYLPKAFVSLD